MASSGSYARGDQPRSVPDDLKGPYDEAMRKQGAYNNKQHGAPASGTASPQVVSRGGDPENSLPDAIAAGLANALGSARRAREKWVNGDKVEAMVDGVLEGPDSFLVAGAAKGALKKGGAKYLGPYDWHTPPWKQPGARRWLEENGFVNPGEQGHHWAIPQNRWGKIIPDFIKNQPWNIKSLDPVTHRRVHGRAKVDGEWLPQFNALEQVWYGTPAYFKAMIMKGATDLSRLDEQKAGSSPRRPEPPPPTSYQRR